MTRHQKLVDRFWVAARFVVVIGGVTALLHWQATDFDWTEIYTVVELGVVLLAFELGAQLGPDRPGLANLVRFGVVLLGMGILLFLNAQSFDDTEKWVLIGLPAILAVFEGGRTWITVEYGAAELTPNPAAGAPAFPSLMQTAASVAREVYQQYTALSPHARSAVVLVLTGVLGPFAGFSISEVLNNVPQANKPAVRAVADNPLDALESEQDPEMRKRLLAEVVDRYGSGVRLVEETGFRQDSP